MNQNTNHRTVRINPIIILFALLIQSPIFAQQPAFTDVIKGKGKPVLFIPGYACTGEIWDETINEFDREIFECHVLSLAGFGKTEGIMTENYLERVASDISDYISSNRLDQPIIIGHSLGGLVALLVGINSGSSIEKIVCVDTWPFTPAAIDPEATVESQTMMAETYFKFDSIPLGIKYSQTREEVKPYVEVLTRCQDKVGMLLDMTVNSEDRICKQAMFDMFTIDTRSKLSEISAPVLILGTWFAYKDYGITAESTTEALTVQYSNLKSKEIYVHSDSGHFIMWDAPEWFMYHLFKFLK